MNLLQIHIIYFDFKENVLGGILLHHFENCSLVESILYIRIDNEKDGKIFRSYLDYY